MNLHRIIATALLCMMAFSLVIANNNDRAKLGDTRSITMPSFAILDENAQPLIALSGKVGFLASITSGALVSFSLTSGKIISSVAVGDTIGPITMIESANRRLIAVPAANDPLKGHPATVSIIDATDAKELEVVGLIALPPAAQITTTTRAFLTEDGKFCLIASSFDEPSLYSLNVETGQVASWLPLLGRASEVEFFEQNGHRNLAFVSVAANELSLIDIDSEGQLSLTGNFIPSGARFEETNNIAFSADGRRVYVAAATGNRLFQLDARSGALLGSARLASPQRVTVARDAERRDLIGVTRADQSDKAFRGGATLFTHNEGQLQLKSEFTPPDEIAFSRANNVVFDQSGATAFIGSATGMLFAFDVETGELESHQTIGSELRRIALSETTRALAAVRSAASGDEIVIINFDIVAETEEGEADSLAPLIQSLKPNRVEQGQRKEIKLAVFGENFSADATLLVNGQRVAATFKQAGGPLLAKLPNAFFNQAGTLSIQVQNGDGSSSNDEPLAVVRPADPLIDRIKPTEIAGPGAAFALKVVGKNFRNSSIIQIGDQLLNTNKVSDRELRAEVPPEIAGRIGTYRVLVKDSTVPDLLSNDQPLDVFGPRIRSLQTNVETVVAGDSAFVLRLQGDNFREGASVEINGEALSASRVRRASSRLLKATVPARFFQSAGKLAVAVRNTDGAASTVHEVDAEAPEIREFLPGQVLAGVTSAKLALRGTNFRKRLQLFVGNSEGQAVRLERSRVRFRSSTRILVTLDGELSGLLAQPGTLRFQVVNPNKGDGVPSVEHALDVVAPNITQAEIQPLEGDDQNVRIVLKGEHFRTGATVEIVKGDAVQLVKTPEKLNGERIIFTMRSRRLEGLGNFEMVVVNPGNVRSNGRQPERGSVAGGNQQ